ncbi:MAG: hypothetical protein NTV51_10180 [Verrucomicrobia bacterium]|nr:hypothetical protein [Verrucomicrobiota bacterium]
MNRLQWFKIAPLDRKALKVLGEKLLRMPYGHSNRAGFDTEDVRSDFISGRFIERVEFTEVVLDPFGVEMKIDRVRFDMTEFSIYSEIQLIECLNAGRNLNNFLNEIAKASNFSVAISKVEIPLQDFSKLLKSTASSMLITKALTDDIELGDGVIGQLQAAGAVDIRKSLQRFLGEHKHTINRLRIALEVEGEKLVFEASKAGVISSYSPIQAKFRRIFRHNVSGFSVKIE